MVMRNLQNTIKSRWFGITKKDIGYYEHYQLIYDNLTLSTYSRDNVLLNMIM